MSGRRKDIISCVYEEIKLLRHDDPVKCDCLETRCPDNISAPAYVTIKNGTTEFEFDFYTYGIAKE